MADSKINLLLKEIPNTPGVYKMKDVGGKLLYVGKAKALNKRVRSYFRKQKNVPLRTKKLVEQIANIEWIEVGSDLEALLLETNLIKEYKPKYNVLMKDDKNFVYLKITKEDYPRVVIVRKVLNDGAMYFGPKTAARKLEKTLNLLQKIFNYRSCNLNIEWLHIGKVAVTNKSTAYPCLDFHIKRCEAPCIANIGPEEYKKNIDKIIAFFEGKCGEIEIELKMKMVEAAQSKNFELAAKIRDKLTTIKELMEKQIISSPENTSADVISFVLDNEKAYFNLFMVRDGKLINRENFILDASGYQKNDEEQAHEVVESFLFEYYQKAAQIPEEILIPIALDENSLFQDFIDNFAGGKVRIIIPLRGKKHSLLDLANKNAESFRKQHIANWELNSNDDNIALSNLAAVLQMQKIPFRIECYDISHLSGTNTVASMVVFEKGKSKSTDYRKFRIRTLNEGEIDDFTSLSEVIFRRLLYLSKSYSDFKFKKSKGSFLAIYKKKIIAAVQAEIFGKSVFLKNFQPFKYMGNSGLERIFLNYLFERSKINRVYIMAAYESAEDLESIGFERIKTIPAEFMRQMPPHEKKDFWVFDKNKVQDPSFSCIPDLIVIDGGKGQLSAAVKARNTLKLKIPIISLAKREEEVFVEFASKPLDLQKNSQASFLLQRIRDEAHRFAITFQRKSREDSIRASVLDSIPGLGDKTKMSLLKHFGSVEMIKSADLQEITALTGKDLAERIQAHLIK